MQISVRTDGTITQYGESLGDLDDHTIIDVSDDKAGEMLEPGAKTWDAETQSIVVTPPEPVVVPDPGPDPRLAAVEALIATASTPEQAAALRQFAEAFGIALP